MCHPPAHGARCCAGRQAGTIALSFLVFPKPFSPLYVYGTLLVLGGLTAYAYVKDARRAKRPHHGHHHPAPATAPPAAGPAPPQA